MKLCPRCQKQFSDDANFCPVDAARLAPLEVQAAAADALAARFDLGDQLGGSRTGAVHRATDKTTGAAVAVKIIAPAVVALPGLAQRLERELKQLERVQSGGVARVIASGKRGDDSWVAMELLEDVLTLATAVSARGAMPADKAARLIEIIGEALIEAAQVGVVHRDLAPKNIVFAGDDVKLINFSLPVPPGDRSPGGAPGVPEFVAPEQHDGKQVDQRSNLYSLGALYYFLLTAQPVQFDAAGAIAPPGSLAEVPQEVEAVILRALDRSPTKRFLTVRQFIDEVGRVAKGEPGLRSTQPLGQPLARAGGKPRAELVQTLVDMHPAGEAAGAGTGTMLGVGPLTVPPAEADGASGAADRSPWAPPAAAPAEPSVIASVPGEAPPIGAAQLAVPVAIGPGAAAARKPVTDDAKGKFRETMWFKKGELDSQAAEAAVQEQARTGAAPADKADHLPIDERYKDDGSLSRADKEAFSLRTGATQTNPALRDPARPHTASGKVSEDALIDEMKGGRSRILAIIAVAVVALALLIILIAR